MKIMSAALLMLSVSGLKNSKIESKTANLKSINSQQNLSPTAQVIQFPTQHLRGTQNHRFLHATEAPTPSPTTKSPTDLDEPSTCAFLKSELDKTKVA